jgi:hypothetical protein
MATRARHFMAVPHVGWPAAPGTGGGVFKSPEGRRAVSPQSLPSAGFFIVLRVFGRRGRGGRKRRAERGQPGGLGLRPPKRCAASPPRPCQPDPGAIAKRVFHHAQTADFRRIIFPFSGRLSGSDDLQGNNGNMGTSYVRQAESRASRVREPVPKPLGGFGNMGTEMADPDAGKSARVWLPPAPSGR